MTDKTDTDSNYDSITCVLTSSLTRFTLSPFYNINIYPH